MAKQTLTISDFSGQMARTSAKKDIPFSARLVQSLTSQEDPTYLTQIPGAVDSGSGVEGLPTWFADASPWSTDRYACDDLGNIYKIDNTGTYSVDRSATTINGNLPFIDGDFKGQGFDVYSRFLYYASQSTIGRKSLIDGAYDDDFLTTGGLRVDKSNDATGQAYVPPTSVDESSTHRKSFIPEKEPWQSISLYIDAVGTGDWTILVHDSYDNMLASVTVDNSNLTTGYYEFVFSEPLRLLLGETYHFHVLSTVADGDVDCGSSSNLETARYYSSVYILVPADWHAMARIYRYLAIANEQYVAVWDGAQFDPHRLTFGPGWNAHSMAYVDEFLVIGAWRGQDRQYVEEARLFFWDGFQQDYNFSRPVAMGLPQALSSNKNRLIGVYGNQGDIYLGSEPFQRVQKIDSLGRGKHVEVFPGAISDWSGLTAIGYAGQSNDTDSLNYGVYTWGSRSEETSESFTYASPPPTGTTTGSDVAIGAVKGFGQDLWFGFSDDTTHSVATIIPGTNPASVAKYESLIFDDGNPNKRKVAFKATATFSKLGTGDELTLRYRIDRGAWVDGPAATEDDTQLTIPIYNSFREIEFGYTLDNASGDYTEVYSIQFEFDDKAEELNHG